MSRSWTGSEAQKKLKDRINATKGCKCIKLERTENGTPDLMASMWGRCTLLEVKGTGDTERRLQSHRKKEWLKAGAYAYTVTICNEEDFVAVCCMLGV